jgi:hypothetical protein
LLVLCLSAPIREGTIQWLRNGGLWLKKDYRKSYYKSKMNKIVKYGLIVFGFFAIAIAFIFFKDEQKKRPAPGASQADENLLADTKAADDLRELYNEETEEEKPRALRLYKKMLTPEMFALAFGDLEVKPNE